MRGSAGRLGRAHLVAIGVALGLLLLTLARGPVALVAPAGLVLIALWVLVAVPLLGSDLIDWHRFLTSDETPPDPSVATLRHLLSASAGDESSTRELHSLVGDLAAARLETRRRHASTDEAPPTPGRDLAAYLSESPPRPLTRERARAVVTDLEEL